MLVIPVKKMILVPDANIYFQTDFFRDMAGRITFATSGGSGIGKTAEKLADSIKNVSALDAKLVHDASEI